MAKSKEVKDAQSVTKKLNGRINKKTQTVRERTAIGVKTPNKRVRKTVKKISSPINSVKKLHEKHYSLPMPDNKIGRLMNKRVKLFPKFLVDSFKELKLVHWTTRRETMKLTIAVFVFAFVFATLVGVIDFGLSKAFEKFIVK